MPKQAEDTDTKLLVGGPPPSEVITLASGAARSVNDRKIASFQRKTDKRINKSVKDADAAAAYRLASDMGEILSRIERVTYALHLTALGSELDRYEGGAIVELTEVISESVEKAKKLHDEIVHRTWAYDQGKVKTVLVEPEAPREPDWPKETLDKLQNFVDERRPIQTT